jgi:hypothetical protein
MTTQEKRSVSLAKALLKNVDCSDSETCKDCIAVNGSEECTILWRQFMMKSNQRMKDGSNK